MPGVWGGRKWPGPNGIGKAGFRLHTLRADIDYGFAEAATTYGLIGIKVIIFKGEKLAGKGYCRFLKVKGIIDHAQSKKS